MKRKRILAGLLVAAAGVVVADWLAPPPPPSTTTPSAAVRPAGQSDPTPRFAVLPAREAIGEPQGELFRPHSWAPQAGPAPARRVKPSPPAVPYRVAGQVEHANGTRVVLARGDRIFEVREGDTLDDGYRVESIKPDAVTLVHVPSKLREQLLVSGPTLQLAAKPAPVAARADAAEAGAAPAAQLRFEGPKRVQAGSPFSVALKLTSDQPVGPSPLELSFDAKLLQPVSVRPGERFADGRFSYRVNPKGSIFVGASGRGRRARDDALLIVTFKPIAEGATELTVAALALQGTEGRAIAHEPPAAFRASIGQ